MRRTLTLFIIIFASFVVAIPFSPRDPISYYVNVVVILCVAIPSYLVGVRHGRMSAGIRDSSGTQDAANTK